MSEEWLTRLPATTHGHPVQRPAKTDIVPPPGYDEPVGLVDPYEAHIFQSFQRRNADGTVSYALRLDERHGNDRGVVHGGVLMTFADSTLGFATWTAYPPGTWCVTVSQSSNFLRAVRVGDVLEVTPAITRATRTMIFTRGDYYVRGEMVFQANSVWKVTGGSAVGPKS